jgi:hypothetical protein
MAYGLWSKLYAISYQPYAKYARLGSEIFLSRLQSEFFSTLLVSYLRSLSNKSLPPPSSLPRKHVLSPVEERYSGRGGFETRPYYNDAKLFVRISGTRITESEPPVDSMLNFRARGDSLMRNQLDPRRNNTVAKKSFSQIAVA